jgi:hypothetical protein
MSSATLAMLAPESKSAASKTSSKTLKVNEPGDAHEREADKAPINKKANSVHLNKMEKTVKKSVNTDKKVASYKVEVTYGSHPAKPKRM